MENIEKYFGYLLRRMHQKSTAIFSDEMIKAQLDLTPRQFAALSVISHNKEIDQARLADLVGTDRATIGGITSRLIKKNLIIRQVSKTDRRARLLSIKTKGLELLSEAEPLVQALQLKITHPLNDAERKQLFQLLHKAHLEAPQHDAT